MILVVAGSDAFLKITTGIFHPKKNLIPEGKMRSPEYYHTLRIRWHISPEKIHISHYLTE